MEVTFASIHSRGKVPESTDLLKTIDNDLQISHYASFKTRGSVRSGSGVLLSLILIHTLTMVYSAKSQLIN